jgi:dephospho-CoA kinase
VKLIGLTGGIASGKSTVGRMLQKMGVPLVDADVLAREVVEPGQAALAKIVQRFGPTVLDATGTLDRKALGAIVFADAAARADLNAITHPEVARLASERLEAIAKSHARVAVYEVPLLFESGLEVLVDETILVAAAPETQLARLMRRDHLDEAAARARIATQMSLDEKRRRATWVIENDTTLEELERRVHETWDRALA